MANKQIMQIMTLGQLRYVVSLRQAEVRAVCACGHPVAGIVIKNDFNAQESGRFLAGAYRDHLKAAGAWEHPAGHALTIEVERLDTEVRGPLIVN